MEYVYAALFLHSAGIEVTEENLKKVSESVGLKSDEIKIKALVASLKEINIDEAIKSQAIAVQQAAPPVAAQAAAKEKPKEKEEKKTGEALEGLSALFG